MKILGKSGKVYDVIWIFYGYTYVEVLIREEVPIKLLGFTLSTKMKTLWRDRGNDNLGIRVWDAEMMLRPQMEKWFQRKVDFYENWQESWTNSGDLV